MKFTQSSRRSPCPVCGRTKDGDCRFNADVIYCHKGSTNGPPEHLKIGDVIQADGLDWYLAAVNAGFDKSAHCFKPHKPLERGNFIRRINPQAVKQIDDLYNLEADLKAFDALALQALSIPPLETLLDEDIFAARNACSDAYQRSLGLIKRLTRIKRRDASYDHVLSSVLVTQKQLHYQLQDLENYCANPAKYWEKHLLQRSSWDWLNTSPEAEDDSDWQFWNEQPYTPKDPLVRQMYFGRGGDQ